MANRTVVAPMRSAGLSIVIGVILSAGSIHALPSIVEVEDEVTLFDGRGNAAAYVSTDDEQTIYLWSGKPVAYLAPDSSDGFHVYGYNGKHLGWFVAGVVRDHEGNAACAVKERFRTTQFEPFKAFRQFKPFKSFKDFAPHRPSFSTSWGDTPCRFLLAEGGV
jgi:4-fold beta flower protein